MPNDIINQSHQVQEASTSHEQETRGRDSVKGIHGTNILVGFPFEKFIGVSPIKWTSTRYRDRTKHIACLDMEWTIGGRIGFRSRM